MNTYTPKLIAILMLGFIASGCTTFGGDMNEKQKITKVTNQITSVDDRLIAAAESVSKSVKELAIIESYRSPRKSLGSNEAPDGLNAKLNVNWSGSVDEFMESAVKASAGYTLKTLGKKPAIPVIVTINAKNISLYDLIRDAGIQCGARANITIDASDEANKFIILEYPA